MNWSLGGPNREPGSERVIWENVPPYTCVSDREVVDITWYSMI